MKLKKPNEHRCGKHHVLFTLTSPPPFFSVIKQLTVAQTCYGPARNFNIF